MSSLPPSTLDTGLPPTPVAEAVSPPAAEHSEAAGLFGDAVPQFPTSQRSPFADRYDIDGERRALRDLTLEQDFDKVIADARYPRYLELERREEMLQVEQKVYRQRDGAEPVVGFRDAEHIASGLGRLTDEETDSISVHTRDAARLFIGRQVEPGQAGHAQSSGKKVGAALRLIWYLSGNDNPYADFALIEATTRIAHQIGELNKLTAAMEADLAKLKTRGLNYSVLRADPPVTVELGFRSPYGYSVVNLISTFDYHVRVVKTLARKDMMTDRDAHKALFTQASRCRSIFENVIRFQRHLMRDEMRPLCRADWIPTADEAARKRVQAAVALFGELPRKVFNGAVMPRHSRRRLDLNEQELRVLNEVPLAGHDHALESATEALV